MRTEGENRASEPRLEEFSLEQAKLVKRKSVTPFNANEQDTFAPVSKFCFRTLTPESSEEISIPKLFKLSTKLPFLDAFFIYHSYPLSTPKVYYNWL